MAGDARVLSSGPLPDPLDPIADIRYNIGWDWGGYAVIVHAYSGHVGSANVVANLFSSASHPQNHIVVAQDPGETVRIFASGNTSITDCRGTQGYAPFLVVTTTNSMSNHAEYTGPALTGPSPGDQAGRLAEWTLVRNTAGVIGSYNDDSVDAEARSAITIPPMSVFLTAWNGESSTPGTPPTITTQPQSRSVTAGASASFSVAASGTSATFAYQWQRKPNGSPTWGDLSEGGSYSGAGTGTLTVGNTTTAMSGDQFRCVVSYSMNDGAAMSAAVADSFTIPTQSPANTSAPPAIYTLAGRAGSSGGIDGAGSDARFCYPGGVAVDGTGNVYAADIDNHAIRKIAPTGVVTTLAGKARSSGSTDGTGADARFRSPQGVAVDTAGDVYVADTLNHTIRKATAFGVVSTLAGLAGTNGSADGTGGNARFDKPEGLAIDGAGNLYVADTGNHTIRMIDPGSGVVATVAGLAGHPGGDDGPGSAARSNFPSGVAVDRDGTLYVTDEDNHTIRKIDSLGVVSTLAGQTGLSGSGDGPGAAAMFKYPSAMAVDEAGNAYVADTGNHTIRKITPSGVVSTLAGQAGTPGSADGMGDTASFDFPAGMAVDDFGNVYVADTNNHTLRLGLWPAAPAVRAQTQSQAMTIGSMTSDAATLTVIPAQPPPSGGGGGGAMDASLVLVLALMGIARYLSDSFNWPPANPANRRES